MKIRIYDPQKDSDKTFWLPTGFLFSKAGMHLLAKSASAQARKDYEKKLETIWRTRDELDVDDLVSLEDVQQAERLDPPITEEQAREMFAALKDSKYLMHGLPLFSLESTKGFRVRIDL
ncbi:MAG: hypothetical protein IJX84_03105 [Clostridia bacterium]|nr:hypothetical protein [Clostridia bacterium]